MRNEFEAFVNENKLFSKSDRVLLALSGGADSVVLASLLLDLGYTFSAAHCNFHLRGEESNRDEAFVRSWARGKGVELFVKSFDTYSYMRQKGVSLEMAARELRYGWFEDLIREHHFAYLATAHHADDSAETFFINLLRGTGIAGLHGILPKHGNIVRPLLFATKKDIKDFAEREHIPYVEDSTNSQADVMRNKIRIRLLPLLKELNPNFDSVMRKNIERLRDTESVFRDAVQRVKNEIVQRENDYVKIPVEKLCTLSPARIYAYEILSDYGFNETVASGISSIRDAESGRQFFSRTHCLLKDRDYLYITELAKQGEPQSFFVKENQTLVSCPLSLRLETIERQNLTSVPKNKNIAILDKERLSFPLELRHWTSGDRFVPFGMRKEKKLSDFFTAEKYSRIEKERQWLLCSAGEIVWVVGRRLDERFKVCAGTKTVLRIEIE